MQLVGGRFGDLNMVQHLGFPQIELDMAGHRGARPGFRIEGEVQRALATCENKTLKTMLPLGI